MIPEKFRAIITASNRVGESEVDRKEPSKVQGTKSQKIE